VDFPHPAIRFIGPHSAPAGRIPNANDHFLTFQKNRLSQYSGIRPRFDTTPNIGKSHCRRTFQPAFTPAQHEIQTLNLAHFSLIATDERICNKFLKTNLQSTCRFYFHIPEFILSEHEFLLSSNVSRHSERAEPAIE
jgi:hypothetical protein